MSQLKLGFVGLGIMGAPMAGHLVAAGHTVYVNTRSKVPEAIAKSAAIQCASPAEVAEKADIIFTMVPDTPDVERVLFGDKGIASGLANGGKGKVVVDMSSISPIATKEFAKKINALGADYLDAPVKKLASVDAPLPYAANLEKLALPKTHNIVESVLAICEGL